MRLGWLSPDGDFIECGSYNHVSTARDLCARLGYHPENFERTADDTLLLNHGWAYIGKSELDYCYRIYWNRFLTEQQKAVLKEYLECDSLDKYCKERLLAEYD